MKIQKILLLILFTSSCAVANNEMNKIESNVNSIQTKVERLQGDLLNVNDVEGWNADPNAILKGDLTLDSVNKNWFYKKYKSKPIQRALEIKSESFMESSCKRNALKENADNILTSAINSTLDVPSTEADLTDKLKAKKDELSNIEVVKCFSDPIKNSFSDCSCILSYKVDGGKEGLKKKL